MRRIFVQSENKLWLQNAIGLSAHNLRERMIFPFGKPTAEELSHHYLWRIRKALPTAGHIGVFDRSHYEDVLIVRVHNLVPPPVWEPRYDEINAFERQLVDDGMALVKVAMFSSVVMLGWTPVSTAY